MSGADARGSVDERPQEFGPVGWRAQDDQAMGRSVVDLPPSITSIPDDGAQQRHFRRSAAYDGTQHWSHG
jgi:zona occludens toxin